MKPISEIPDQKNVKAFEIIRIAIESLKRNKPFVIGITGAGGAGKTTFGINIARYYGEQNCVSIDLDDYLISRDERGKLEVTGYNPLANKLFLARQNIEDLAVRKTILKPKYDHATGRIMGAEEVSHKELIVIEGVTTLYPELKDLNDISFFLDAQEATQIKSRIERDVKKRGYSLEQALTLYNNLKPDYERFIAPTKGFASVILEVSPDYIMHTIHIAPELNKFIKKKLL